MKHALKTLKRVNKKIKGRKRKIKTLKNMARFRLSTLDEKNMRKHPGYKSLLKPKKTHNKKTHKKNINRKRSRSRSRSHSRSRSRK